MSGDVTLSRLRDEYVQMRAEHYGFPLLYAEEWDRALVQHDAEVRAKALRDTAESLRNMVFEGSCLPVPVLVDVADWLDTRAAAERGEGNG